MTFLVFLGGDNVSDFFRNFSELLLFGVFRWLLFSFAFEFLLNVVGG